MILVTQASLFQFVCSRDCRCYLSVGIFLVPLDVLSAVCFLLHHVIPFRLHLLYREMLKHWSSANERSMEYYGSERSEVALYVIWEFMQALVDAICCLLGGLCTLLTPTLWHCTGRGVCQIFSHSSVHAADAWSQSRWDDAYENLRLLMLSRVLYMPIDWFCCPLGAFALVSPFRHVPFRHSMQETGFPLCGLGLELCSSEDSPAERAFDRSKPVSDQFYNDYSYNAFLRKNCLYYGSTAVVDVLLFPVFLPLLLTWYRYHPVRAELFDVKSDKEINDTIETTPSTTGGKQEMAEPSSTLSPAQRTVAIKQWGFREYGIIARQFSFLVLDALFVPLLLLIYLTQYRYDPVRRARAEDDLCSWYSLSVYAAILITLFYILMDILVLPFLMLLLLTSYRAAPLVNIWSNKSLWHGYDKSALLYHISVLSNGALVVHDILFVPLLILILIGSGIRATRAVRIIKAVWTTSERQKYCWFCCKCHEAASSGVDMNQDGGDLIFGEPSIGLSSSWRVQLWSEFVNVIWDLPFVVMSIVVLLTLWRAKLLLEDYRKIDTKFPDLISVDHSEQCCDEDDCCCCCCCDCCMWYNRRNWALRFCALTQFLLLLRDIVVFIPLSVLLGTFYRFPAFVLDILNKCSPMNSTDKPVYEAIEVNVECPETAGPILITIKCQRTISNDTTSDLEMNAENSATYNPKSVAKLFVSGDGFWESVGAAFGDSVMRIGEI